MRILDSHVHLWHPVDTPRPLTPLVRWLGARLTDRVAPWVFPADAAAWYATPKHLTRPYLIDDYRRDAAHHDVVGVVHVEAGWAGDPVDETRWLERLRREGAPIVAIVGRCHLDRADVGDVLTDHADASDAFVGIREVLFWHDDPAVMSDCSGPDLLDDPAWRAGFTLLAEHDLHFETCLYEHQLPALARLATDHPETTIVLCHLGTPVGMAGPFCGVGTTTVERQDIERRWHDGMQQLAACPNVRIKLSGITLPAVGHGFETAPEPVLSELIERIGPPLQFAIDTFGPQRCWFASNFPIDKASVPFDLLFDAYRAIGDDPGLFHDNAAALYLRS